MKEKLISIIIVNYNSGHYLLECIRSLMQTVTLKLEIWIADNGSTDDSLVAVQNEYGNDPCLKIILNKKNLGFSKANNNIVPLTQGDYLLFLNPDCIIKPDTLEQVRQRMDENPDAGMAGCLIRNVDGSIQTTSVRNIPTPWNSLVRVLHLNKLFPKQKLFAGLDIANNNLPVHTATVEAISGAFMFVRKLALADVGLLDENYFLYCEDIDWMMRFRQKGWKILYMPDVEIIHAKSVCSQKIPFRVLWYKHRGMMYFYRKFFRQKYSLVLMLLVYLGIWVRYGLLLVFTVIQFFIKKKSSQKILATN